MSFFNALYTLADRTTQPVQNTSQIKIDFDDQSGYAQAKRWTKWVVTLPVTLAHGTFNTVYMLATNNINRVLSSQVYEGNSIHYFPSLIGKSGHVITSSRLIAVITPQYRDDDNGFFEVEKEDPFTPILQDLYPDEAVDQDDFLLTCSHGNVDAFRNPLLKYVGPKALPRLRPEIDQISREILDSVASNEPISARYLAETYTVAILARLFLNHPGSLKDFQAIGRAASRVVEYQFIKKWGSPNAKQSADYVQDLQTLRDAIDCSGGEFVESLRRSDLSAVQTKGELLLTYIAGSETTSSTLHYILWRLGQDSDLQEAIRNDPGLVDPFINNCMREYTPIPFFSRWARQDLVLSVDNRDGSIWEYPIAKGEGLILAPNLAKSSLFGSNKYSKHSCPGQWLALAEMRSMILQLVNRHDTLSFPNKKELSVLPGSGFPKVEPVDLLLQPR